MSGKRWADDVSSDGEGSVDPEDEPVVQQTKGPAHASSSNKPQAPVQRAAAPQQDQQAQIVGFVTFIPMSASRDEVGRLFADMDCKINVLDIKSSDDGRSQMARFVFDDRESLDIFLRADGVSLHGKSVRTSKDLPSSRGAGPGRGGGRQDPRDRDYDGGRRGPGRDREEGRGGVGGRGGGRGGRDSGRDRDAGRDVAPSAPAPPAVRPKLQLAPRTLPLEIIGKPEVKKAEIFGGGKAHDEAEYEEVKKRLSSETTKVDAPVAPESVFKFEAVAESLATVATEGAPVAAPDADTPARDGGKGGRGSSAAGRGASGGRWGREVTASAPAGAGRGGRGAADSGGRGRGRGGRGASGPPAAEAAAATAEPSAQGSYVIEKPLEEGDKPADAAAPAAAPVWGNREGARKGPREEGAARAPREEGARRAPREDGGRGGGRGAARPVSSGGKAPAAGSEGAVAEGGAADRGPRGKAAGGNGKLFAATAKQTNLLGSSKPKAGADSTAGASSAAPQLSEAERFQLAQEKIQNKEKSASAGSGAAGKAKKVSAFAALNSDSEHD